MAELANIDDGSTLKANTIQINTHDNVPNGKNTRNTPKDDVDDEIDEAEIDDKDDQQKLTALEQQQQRARMAAKQIPMLISLLGVDSYDELIGALDSEREDQEVVSSFYWHLVSRSEKDAGEEPYPVENSERINRCLSTIRTIETKNHNQYQDALKGKL